MIHLEIGSLYEAKDHELVLTQAEWDKLQHNKAKCSFWGEDGIKFTIRLETAADRKQWRDNA